MAPPKKFSEAARIAALQARRESNALKAANPNPLEVFVIRDGVRYRWEIRKFGAVLVKEGMETYASASQARDAGGEALKSHYDEAGTAMV